MPKRAISLWLDRSSPVVFTVFAISGAFITYFSMYAFRKPLTAATYEGLAIAGVDYKIIAIIVQVCGYALSKFVGIRVISELQASTRIVAILSLIGVAWVALLCFALVPSPWNVVILLLNGLPLGMIWGIVFSFLEGRRFTEILGAGLCASFIVSSGAVKAVGRILIVDFGVSDFWMPFLVGLIFVVPLLAGVLMLSVIPEPNRADKEHRAERRPMDAATRGAFLKLFFLGILMTVSIYVLLNIFRDIRDNFAVEIWNALGFAETPHIIATSEIPVAVCVLIVIGLMSFVRNNRTAFFLNFWIIASAGALLSGSTWLFQAGGLSPVLWMILNGFSMYLAYIAFHTFLFERWIALFRTTSNIGYLMYIADAFGYLGSVGVMLYKNLAQAELDWYQFVVHLGYLTGIATMLLSLACIPYFNWKRPLAEGPESQGFGR